MKTWLVAIAVLAPLTALAQSSEEDRLKQFKSAFNDRLTAQGDVWYEDGEFPRIVQAYKVRTEFFPAYEEAWTDLIFMLFNTQRYEEELATAIRFRELNPDNADAFFPEANIYMRLGVKAYAKAVPLLEKAISMQPPPHPNTYRLLGACYKRMDMIESAIRVYKALVALHPDDEAAKANLRNAEADLKKRVSGG